MAETTTIHAQLIRYSTTGDQIIVNLKNTGADVSIDTSANSKLPAGATTVQGLAAALGKLAFADTIADATTSASGLMTAAMVTKLNGIATGANAYTHPNSGVTAGTYRSVTVNAQGHVTAGTNPTTLAGYGITDAAAKSHKHTISDITDQIPASKITGTLSLDNIPKSAVERVYPVETDEARLKLTTSDVQNGDVVKVTGTGKMYFVVDDTKLTSEAGYMVFSAGIAAEVPWSGVTGKPSTYTPSAHTQAISTITGLQTELDNKFTTADMKAATASAAGTHGLVPAPGAGKQGQFLRGDGTWATPTDTKYTHPAYTAHAAGLYKVTVDATGHVSAVANVAKADITGLGIPAQDTTYAAFKGASSSAGGGAGLVPAPATRNAGQFLRGDGTWATPTDTKYTHPSYTAKASGLYKITVDATGHVSATTAVAKSDITALGIPAQDTKYSNATTSGAGLMSAADKTKLDAVEEWIISSSAPSKNCMWLKTDA